MTAITFRVESAPTSPLNLKFDVLYAPRKGSPTVFDAYLVREIVSGEFDVFGYDRTGDGCSIYHGDLFGAYRRLARALNMDKEG